MCKKAVVLEIKDDYCLAMTDEGNIVRIRKKSGVREGQTIYVLEEDLYRREHSVKGAAVLPFFSGAGSSGNRDRRRGKAVVTKLLTAAAAVLIFVGTLSLPQISNPAYAAVSLDGIQSVQLELDEDNRVLSAESYDGSVEERTLSDMEGRSLEQLWTVLQSFSAPGEPILIAEAPMKPEAEETADALESEIRRNLKGESICLRGEREDVRKADRQNKSLGLYLLEKAVDEDALEDYFGENQGEKIAEFLEKYQEKIPQIYQKYVQLSGKDDDDDEQDRDDADDREGDDDRDESGDDDRGGKPGGGVTAPGDPDDEDADVPSDDGNDDEDEDETGDSDEDEGENEEESDEESRDEKS